MIHLIPVGTSEPQDFQLKDDGAALVGTGLDVDLEVTSTDGDTLADVANGLTAWAASTAYVEGDVVRPVTANDHAYVCTVAGTSDSSAPTFPTSSGQTVTDGSVTWTEVAPTVAWLAQASGTVRVTGTEALPVGGYRVRYKLTDGSDKVGYAPNGAKADLWQVVALDA